MQLGIFTKDKKSGVFTGDIKTLTNAIDSITVVPITKRGEGPDYRVHGPNGSDFGAGWNKIAKETNKPYISLTLRDPSFNNGEPLYPILIEGEDAQFVMAWDTPDPERAAAPPRPVTTPAEKAKGAASTPAPAGTRNT